MYGITHYIQYFHWPNPGSQLAYRMTGSSSSKTNAHVCCYVNKWRKAAFYKDFIYKYTAVSGLTITWIPEMNSDLPTSLS